jgi:putative Holliday junction resolvase
MRLIAIDLGDKRTGLAMGDSVTAIASPAGVVEIPITLGEGRALLDAIAARIDDLVGTAPAELVLGFPLNMDGTEGPRAKLVRPFADRLRERTGRAVHLHDERRTSELADERMARTGLTHKQKKARRDAIAAAAILQSFLDSPPEELGHGGGV